MMQALNLPDFSQIKPEQIEAQLSQRLSQARQQIEQLSQLEQPTWDNFALPLQSLEQGISDYFSPIGHLNAVKNSTELRKAYQQCLDLLTDYSSEVGQNSQLFAQYQKLAQSADYAHFTPAQQQWIEHGLRDFRLAGVALSAEKKAQFKANQQQLAQLGQTFSNHVLDATAAWSKHIEDDSLLAGLPAQVLALLQQNAQKKGLTGYLLGLDFPTYHAVMSYASHRALREEMYFAYLTKASESGPQAGQFDNSSVMVEILRLRQEQALLLGYENYCQLSLASKMADSIEQVCSFLLDLAEQAQPFAEREYTVLAQYAQQHWGIDELCAWDVTFVSEQYRQQHFNLSQEVLREYFPLNQVLQGLFSITEKLYRVEIKAEPTFSRYDDDVALFSIHQDGQLIAGFYTDLFARDNKRGGAWMDDCRSRWRNADNQLQLPVAYLSCNFRPAQAGQQALLSHDEVTTLFHEFGHSLHHMLTAVDVAGVSGIAGVEWDAVELPSQFMENWCWQKPALALISAHYQTGDALPDDLLANLLAAKNFNAGLMMLRQIEFALFDMLLHSMTHIDSAEQIQEVLEQVREKVALIETPEEVRFQHGFSHIFAGGYAAGYYSYKWAEVLSADAFSLFEENGIFDAATGQRFLQEILQQGSARSAAQSFAAFRGRPANSQALLKHSGLL